MENTHDIKVKNTQVEEKSIHKETHGIKNINIEHKIDKRTQEIIRDQEIDYFKRIDKFLAIVLTIQWFAMLIVSYKISPMAWAGSYSSTNIHFLVALLMGGLISSLPIYSALTNPGKVETRYFIAIAQILMSSLLIHLTGGRIESHFYTFVSLALLAFYADWKLLVVAAAFAGADRFIRGVYWPQSIYGVVSASSWRWVEHEIWILLETGILSIACLKRVGSNKDIAKQQSRLEATNEIIEQKVIARTEELQKANQELIKSNKRIDLIFSALAEALPGTVLDEKYSLDKKIGSGGFGAVYKARHLGMKREVAVKIFRPATTDVTPEGIKRFLLEAISSSRVNHPNAITVLDSGISTEGIAYLVMELLKGRNLTEELEEKSTLNLQRCIEIIVPVCDVLAEAHSVGIVHRDIKPDNIFLNQTKEGEVIKVVDFGIAKMIGDNADKDINSLTATGAFLGTPVYMSPEQLENKNVDGKTDIYSLGIMLYQMLIGGTPFQTDSGNIFTLIYMHLSKEPTPLRELNKNIPKSVEDIVMRTLAKDPAKRPTASELAREFREINFSTV